MVTNTTTTHACSLNMNIPAFVIGAIIGALSSTVSQVIQNKGFNNFSWGSFGVGTLTGAIGGGIADALPGVLGQSAATSLGGNIAKGALNGALTGSVAGGVGSALSGGNFWNGALGGAIGGGIGGGFGGLLEGNPLGNALRDAPKLAMIDPPVTTVFGGALDEVMVWGSRAAVGVEAGFASIGAAVGVGLYGLWRMGEFTSRYNVPTPYMLDARPSQYDIERMLRDENIRMANKDGGNFERMGNRKGGKGNSPEKRPRQAAKKLGVDEHEFGDILHDYKSKNGLGPTDNLTWKELMDLGSKMKKK
jgi:hypothetical protein